MINGYEDKATPLQDDRVMIRIMIPTRMAGSVIGKGGAQVKQMRSDYGTQIIIPESSGEERLIRCHVLIDEKDGWTGQESETLAVNEDALKRCCLVVKRIAEYLQEAEVRFAGGDLNDLRSTLGVQGPDVDVRLLINESLGQFLRQKQDGKSRLQLAAEGAMVKEMMIFDELAPRSTDYVLKVVGKPEQISNCCYCLSDLTMPVIRRLAQNFVTERQYDPKYRVGGKTMNNTNRF